LNEDRWRDQIGKAASEIRNARVRRSKRDNEKRQHPTDYALQSAIDQHNESIKNAKRNLIAHFNKIIETIKKSKLTDGKKNWQIALFRKKIEDIHKIKEDYTLEE